MAVSARMRPMMRRAAGPMARMAARVPPWGVIHHVGRKSGKRYRTPVMAFAGREPAVPNPAVSPSEAPAAGAVVVVTPLPWGSDVDWCRNIRAAGSYTLTRRGRDYLVDDLRVVDSDEAIRLLGVAGRVGSSALRVREWVVGRLRAAPPPAV